MGVVALKRLLLGGWSAVHLPRSLQSWLQWWCGDCLGTFSLSLPRLEARQFCSHWQTFRWCQFWFPSSVSQVLELVVHYVKRRPKDMPLKLNVILGNLGFKWLDFLTCSKIRRKKSKTGMGCVRDAGVASCNGGWNHLGADIWGSI